MNHNYRILFNNQIYSILEFLPFLNDKNNYTYGNFSKACELVTLENNEITGKTKIYEIFKTNNVWVIKIIKPDLTNLYFSEVTGRLISMLIGLYKVTIFQTNIFMTQIYNDDFTFTLLPTLGFIGREPLTCINRLIHFSRNLTYTKNKSYVFYKFDNIIIIDDEKGDNLYNSYVEHVKSEEIEKYEPYIGNNTLYFSQEIVPFWNPKIFRFKTPKVLLFYLSQLYFLISNIKPLKSKDMQRKVFNILTGF